MTKASHPFFKMYQGISENEDQIFSGSLCEGVTKIPDCPQKDLNTIFNNTSVDDTWFFFAYLLEKGVKCSGMKDRLKKYYFTGDK